MSMERNAMREKSESGVSVESESKVSAQETGNGLSN